MLVNPVQKLLKDLLHLKNEHCVWLTIYSELFDGDEDRNRSRHMRCNKHQNLC